MMPKLGSGERFGALEGKLAERPGVRNPGALAASIGMKRYGKSKMEGMAAKGRSRGIMSQHLGGM